MDVRWLLNECRRGREELNQLREELQDKLDSACRGMSARTALRLSGTSRRDSIAEGAMGIGDIEARIAQVKSELKHNRAQAKALLDELDKSDPCTSLLLRKYYIDGMDADALAREQHISRPRMWREMGAAIIALQEGRRGSAAI